MDGAVSGLIGGLIGATASIGAMMIQSHYQAKREAAKNILEFATQTRAQDINLAIARGSDRKIPPIAAYAYQNQTLLKAIHAGDITPEEMDELVRRNKEVEDSLTFLGSSWIVGDAIKQQGL